MNIFLDDVRNPQQVSWVDLPPVAWTVVRSYDELVEAVDKGGIPERISFDHDLADEHYAEYQRAQAAGIKFDYDGMMERTGYHALAWLLGRCAGCKARRPQIWFHTFNADGKANMESLLRSFDRVNPELAPAE